MFTIIIRVRDFCAWWIGDANCLIISRGVTLNAIAPWSAGLGCDA